MTAAIDNLVALNNQYYATFPAQLRRRRSDRPTGRTVGSRRAPGRRGDVRAQTRLLRRTAARAPGLRDARREPSARVDVSGHRLGRRQVADRRRPLPRLRRARPERAAVQAAEHVEQRRRDGGRRRDRPRPGAAGARLRRRAERRHESGAAEAAERRRRAGRRAGPRRRRGGGARLLRPEAAADARRARQLRAPAGRGRSGADRGRRQRRRGQSARNATSPTWASPARRKRRSC